MVTSPKSSKKSAKDEGNFDETPKTDSKRKRTPGTGKDKVNSLNLILSEFNFFSYNKFFYIYKILGTCLRSVSLLNASFTLRV